MAPCNYDDLSNPWARWLIYGDSIHRAVVNDGLLEGTSIPFIATQDIRLDTVIANSYISKIYHESSILSIASCLLRIQGHL